MTPRTMAPTKARATYAATTLSLLMRGDAKSIEKLPWFTTVPALTLNLAERSPPKKPAFLSVSHLDARAGFRRMVKEM